VDLFSIDKNIPIRSFPPSSLRISCTGESQRSTCRQAIRLDVFEGEDDGYDPARHQAEINANPSPALLDAGRIYYLGDFTALIHFNHR
jgi:hypothetical protein